MVDLKRPASARDKYSQSNACWPILKFIGILICFILIQRNALGQKVSISVPIGSTIYQDSEINLTALIEGVDCDKTLISCRKGLVSMKGPCEYIYHCKTVGMDTVDVYIRKGKKLKWIGEQILVVKERPLPKANIGGLEAGIMKKNQLLAQQGVGGSWFVGGNHWESCLIESFTFIVLRDSKYLTTVYNFGDRFSDETKAAIQKLEPGDLILVSNIKGCATHGGGNLKALEFTIN